MDRLHDKKEKLTAYLKRLGRIAVAFSSGVDSTFLLKAAHETLGDNVIAVIGQTVSFPEREYRDAVAFCEELGVKYVVVRIDQMAVDEFRNNEPDRCYHCKKALFTELLKAAQAGFAGEDPAGVCLADGTNADDDRDYRPGMRALRELDVVSPLKDAGLTKQDIRDLSRETGLSTWDKPSFACLATRIPCGEEITPEKLRQIEDAEECLFELGFTQVRVRHHGDVARIEVEPAEMYRLVPKTELHESTAELVVRRLREIGFRYVALDLCGYQTGSMNARGSEQL